jgi:hypothetical protein
MKDETPAETDSIKDQWTRVCVEMSQSDVFDIKAHTPAQQLELFESFLRFNKQEGQAMALRFNQQVEKASAQQEGKSPYEPATIKEPEANTTVKKEEISSVTPKTIIMPEQQEQGDYVLLMQALEGGTVSAPSDDKPFQEGDNDASRKTSAMICGAFYDDSETKDMHGESIKEAADFIKSKLLPLKEARHRYRHYIHCRVNTDSDRGRLPFNMYAMTTTKLMQVLKLKPDIAAIAISTGSDTSAQTWNMATANVFFYEQVAMNQRMECLTAINYPSNSIPFKVEDNEKRQLKDPNTGKPHG